MGLPCRISRIVQALDSPVSERYFSFTPIAAPPRRRKPYSRILDGSALSRFLGAGLPLQHRVERVVEEAKVFGLDPDGGHLSVDVVADLTSKAISTSCMGP